jgi:hypothetical protein
MNNIFTFRIMFSVSRAAALRLGLDDLLPCTDCGNPFPDHLLHQLEILACDSLSLAYRPCETALALLTTYFQQRVAEEPSHSSALMGFVSELQKYCNVSILNGFKKNSYTFSNNILTCDI